MINYTESQLNGMNKTSLVALTLEVFKQLQSAESGPLKASDVEKKMLDLARQATNVQDNAVKREQEHKEALAKIQSDLKLAVAKLELEYKSEEGIEPKALTQMYKDLEAQAKAAADDLTFGLKQAEVETQAKIEELQEKLTAAQAAYQAEIEAWVLKVSTAKAESTSEIEGIKKAHERALEDLKYKNKIILRDEDLSALTEVAKVLGRTVIVDAELADLKAFKAEEEASVTAKIELAVKQAKSEVFATKGAELSALKSSTDSSIALLTKDKEYLTKEVDNLNTRIKSLEAQISAFPGQLKDAVEASKADVTINQDNKK